MELDGTMVREIVDLRATTGYEPQSLIHVVSARDGRNVAVINMEAFSIQLTDVFSGRSTLIVDDALVGGSFSPGGDWLAGVVTQVANGSVDPSTSVSGVFARDGSCSDRAFACVEWAFPQEPDRLRRFASTNAWSPDGKHLLLQVHTPCPDDTGMPPTPCTPDAGFEVYEWPSRRLVLGVPADRFGEAQWAGNARLRVNRGTLLALDGTRSELPQGLGGCCVSFSPDGRYAVDSVSPGEDCSLVEVETGRTLASVAAGDGDTNDTGICQFVSWTSDGRYAIATGVSPP
jgi:hypothetical protein